MMGARNPRGPTRILPGNVLRHTDGKFCETGYAKSCEINVPEDLIDGNGDEVCGCEEGSVGLDGEVAVEEGGVAQEGVFVEACYSECLLFVDNLTIPTAAVVDIRRCIRLFVVGGTTIDLDARVL